MAAKFESCIGVLESRVKLVSDDTSERIGKIDKMVDGEGRPPPLDREDNDLADVKMAGKRKGEEDSLHNNKSCLLKRANNELVGVELNEGTNFETLDIPKRKRAKEFSGDESVLCTFEEGSDQGETVVNGCGEERMPGSSAKQQLRERLTNDPVNGDVQNGTTDQVLPHFKRPQTAWLMFLADRRPEIKASRPGCSVAEVVKVCSTMWSSISEEERAVYDARALKEKQRLQNELKAAGLSKIPPKPGGKGEGYVDLPPDKTTNILLPLARVRKAVRLNGEVKSINKNAIYLVAKATELFVASLAKLSLVSAHQKGRKGLHRIDIAGLVNPKGHLWWLQGEFLADDIKKRDGNGKGSSINFKPSVSTAVTSKPGRKEGMKAITEFFDQWSSSSAFHDKEERGIDESGRLEQQQQK